MIKMRKFLTLITLVACIGEGVSLLSSCSSDDDSDDTSKTSSPVSQDPSPSTKTVYKASSNLSDFTKGVLETVSYKTFPESSVSKGDSLPDLYVVRAYDENEVKALSDEKIKLAIRACLAGKTIFLGNPSINGVATLEGMVMQVLHEDGNEELLAESDLSPSSLHHLLVQFIDKEVETDDDEHVSPRGYEQKIYEAAAMRDGVIYYVHDIDEGYGNEGSITSEAETKTIAAEGLEEAYQGSEEESASTEIPDYNSLKMNAVKKFSDWIDEKGYVVENANLDIHSLAEQYPEARSALGFSNAEIANDPAKKAQRYIHSFTATQDGKTETVEVMIDVWAFCQIDAKEDWYYVRTSVVCNNNQLGFRNTWDDDKHLSPYFKECEIWTNIAKNKQTVRTSDCQPQTSIMGSSSYTSGINVNLTGNVGMAGSGPSAGATGGITIVDTTTTTVPDIMRVFNVNSYNHPHWTFTAGSPEPTAVFSTSCKSPASVTTNMIILDTLSIFTLPSDYEWTKGAVELDTWVDITLERLYGWIEYLVCLHWKCPKNTTSIHYRDLIKKPCNAKGDYVMYFDSPEGTTPERIDMFTRELKEVLTGWDGSKKAFYAVGKENLDNAAKAYFDTIKANLGKNKNVLKSKGFAGTYTFHIKDNEKEDPAASFTITF